jgi:hypothetical protein
MLCQFLSAHLKVKFEKTHKVQTEVPINIAVGPSIRLCSSIVARRSSACAFTTSFSSDGIESLDGQKHRKKGSVGHEK